MVTGPAWGGCLEILHWNLAAGRWIRPAEDYAGCVLLLETSEEMPSAEETFRMLRNFGERGLLAQFPAILVALAKAGGIGHPALPEERARYREEQRAAIRCALGRYNPRAMVVFNLDFGHTDPQWILCPHRPSLPSACAAGGLRRLVCLGGLTCGGCSRRCSGSPGRAGPTNSPTASRCP